jgi:hypothetical protein
VDHPRPDVDTVHGEPESTPPPSLTPSLLTLCLALLVGEEVGADQGVVLAVQGVCLLAEGRPTVGGGSDDGRPVLRPSPRTSSAPRSGQKEPKQRLQETAGDTVTHVVNFLCFIGGHAPGPVTRSRGFRFV